MDNTQNTPIESGEVQSTQTEHLIDPHSVDLGVNPNNQGHDPMPEGYDSPSANAFAEPEIGEQPVTQEQEAQATQVQDWEASAKYFQSEKDKVAAENQKLQQFKQLGDFIESRPDLQKIVLDAASGKPVEGQPQQEASQPTPQEVQPPEDFDPWEAYNKPDSESFKFRKYQETQTVANAIGQYDAYQQQNRQKEQVVTQLDHAIKDAGMSDAERGDFMNWAGQPLSNLRPSELVNMYRAAKGGVNAPPPPPTSPDIAKAREVQQQPTSAGIVQGERPQAPSSTDTMWDGIMNAAGKSRIP